MKKKIVILFISFVYVASLSSQTNYKELLVRNGRTYWATSNSLCKPQWDTVQDGICFDPDGRWDKYIIDVDHDTLSAYETIDDFIFVDHTSYELHEDTIFIIYWWYTAPTEIKPYTEEAYKILYATEQKLLLLELGKDTLNEWRELVYPPCYTFRITEFEHIK